MADELASSADRSWTVPSGLTTARRRGIEQILQRRRARHGDDLLGLVLSGSVGRGIATEHSDLDLYVVVAGRAGGDEPVLRSPGIDEIPVTLGDLEAVPPFGSAGYRGRWSLAWAPVLLDRSGGAIPEALRRQATLTGDEATAILVDHDQVNGWINLAYRALRSSREGRVRESRLDAAESVPYWLTCVFALEGRVRPYNKYLAWELREHPLGQTSGPAVMELVEGMLLGRPASIRAAFRLLRERCVAQDGELATRTADLFADWGDALPLFEAGEDRAGVAGTAASDGDFGEV
jgi:hypothetical protein